MSTSRREQILARIAAVLLNATPAGANVFRSREVSITRGITPSIVVLYGGGKDVTRLQNVDRHELTIQIAIFVRGDPWDKLADAIDAPAHALLMNDQTLINMGVQLFREADQVEAQEADRTAGTLTVPYRTVFLTRANDITAAP